MKLRLLVVLLMLVGLVGLLDLARAEVQGSSRPEAARPHPIVPLAQSTLPPAAHRPSTSSRPAFTRTVTTPIIAVSRTLLLETSTETASRT